MAAIIGQNLQAIACIRTGNVFSLIFSQIHTEIHISFGRFCKAGEPGVYEHPMCLPCSGFSVHRTVRMFCSSARITFFSSSIVFPEYMVSFPKMRSITSVCSFGEICREDSIQKPVSARLSLLVSAVLPSRKCHSYHRKAYQALPASALCQSRQ